MCWQGASGGDLYSSLLHKGTEFSMQSEEFPALPGATPQRMPPASPPDRSAHPNLQVGAKIRCMWQMGVDPFVAQGGLARLH